MLFNLLVPKRQLTAMTIQTNVHYTTKFLSMGFFELKKGFNNDLLM